MTANITKTTAGYVLTIMNARGKVVVKQAYAELPVSTKVAELCAWAGKRFGYK